MPEATPPAAETAPVCPRAGLSPWKQRTVRTLSLGFIVTASLSLVTSDTFAGSEPEAAVSTTAVSDALRLQLASLQERMQADLDARVGAPMNSVLQDATDRQLARMRSELDPARRLTRRIEVRTERDLAALTQQLGDSSLALARGDSPDEQGAPPEPRLRMDTGSLALASQTLEHAKETSTRVRHRFDRPFSQAPQVAVGVRVVHLSRSEQPRVAVRVVAVDADGFDYEVRAWGDPRPADLRADWVAYADPSRATTAQAAMVPASRP